MQKSIYPNKNPVNMASPPSFGITLSCICLPPGISTAPIYTASFFINGIKHATNKNTIEISDIKTTPIVNYFDKKMNNFELIPFSEYSEKKEKNHFLK